MGAVLKVMCRVTSTTPSGFQGAQVGKIAVRVGHYAAALAGVGLATLVGVGVQGFITTAAVALVYVIPVIAAAICVGRGPSLLASVASALAFDFFFTPPLYSLRVDRPDEFWSIILLLSVAASVSALAAQSRSRALRAARMAAQAEALRALAHTVIVRAPRAQVIERAAATLSQSFGAPAVILAKAEKLGVLASSGRPVALRPEDIEAAEFALTQEPSRGRPKPARAGRLDFWPVHLPNGDRLVIGLDFTRTRDGRPANADGVVDSVSACLAAVSR